MQVCDLEQAIEIIQTTLNDIIIETNKLLKEAENRNLFKNEGIEWGKIRVFETSMCIYEDGSFHFTVGIDGISSGKLEEYIRKRLSEKFNHKFIVSTEW